MRLLPLLLTGLLTSLALAASPAANAAPPGDGPVVVTSRTTSLQDGDVVKVWGFGLEPGREYGVVQCDQADPVPGNGCPEATRVTADSRGKVSLRLDLVGYTEVQRDFGPGSPVYCRADQCRVYLTWTDEDDVVQSVASRTLQFSGSPATLAASRSTDLPDRAWVKVTGTAKGAAGRTVLVRQDRCYELVQGAACDSDRRWVPTKVGRDGRFALYYKVTRQVSGTDCGSADELGSCQLTATVLDRAGQPDLTFGNAATFGDPGVPLSFAGASTLR